MGTIIFNDSHLAISKKLGWGAMPAIAAIPAIDISDSVRAELPDFGFEWNIAWWEGRYVLQFKFDRVALQKFNKAYLIELCELLPNQIITKSFKFSKFYVRFKNEPSKPCRCCGRSGNIKRYYLMFTIEKI